MCSQPNSLLAYPPKGMGMGFLKVLYACAFYSTGECGFETHNDLLGLPEEYLDKATLASHNWVIAQAGKIEQQSGLFLRTKSMHGTSARDELVVK